MASFSPLNMTNSDTTAAALISRPGPSRDAFIVCYSPTMITTNGIWQGDNPLDYSLPLFILQSIMIVVVTRCLNSLLARFRQPRLVGEVLGGIIIGPSVLGLIIPEYMDMVFPTRSLAVLETMAELGVVYFVFLVGLQVDLSSISRVGRRVWLVSLSTITLPILVILVLAFGIIGIGTNNYIYNVYFVTVSVMVTAYPALLRILAELKLLNTDTGRLAMAAAILNDSFAWALMSICIAFTGIHTSVGACLATIGSGVFFVLFSYYIIRPTVKWAISRTKEAEVMHELCVVGVLLGVMVFSTLADTLGIHAIFGAFAVGVAVPNGQLVVLLIDKMEDFVTGFLLPLFFGVVGIKVDLKSLNNPNIYGFVMVSVALCAVAKVVATVLVYMFFGMSKRDGLSLGILINTKGIIDLIVLHIGLDKQVIFTQSYTAMIIMSVLMTAAVTPLSLLLQRPSRNLVAYKRRTIHQTKPDSELRMLACIHTTKNVPSLVSLLEMSNPTKRSPIFVYVVHLVELTGRESAMLVVHDTQHNASKRRQLGNINRIQAQADQIIKGLESYEQHAGGVSIQPLTVVSAYSTMHEDVCNLAETKHTALLILPFHKQHTVDGGLEAINPGIRVLNQNVLANAPCSVGMLVDRGIGGTTRIATGLQAVQRVAVLFIRGRDDREALAYAGRIADHPAVNLTVLRFIDANYIYEIEGDDMSSSISDLSDSQVLNVLTERDRERLLDDKCVKEFRLKTMNDDTVSYMEKTVSNSEEMVTAIQSIDCIHDLYIVGRGEGMESALTDGLTEWTENPELGSIGDLLVSSDFTTTESVLVIQQYRGNDQG